MMKWLFRSLFMAATFLFVTACTTTGGGSGPAINSFTANPPTIAPGGTSTLSWNVEDADTVTINQGVGAVDAVGTVTVNPITTTTYTLTATNEQGQETATATVTVQGKQTAEPTITSFTANPPTITAGGSSTLSWNVQGADTVSINQGIGNVDAVGSVSVTPTTTTTYTLTAMNESGQVTAQTTVTVQGGTGENITQAGYVLLVAEDTSGTEMQNIFGVGGFTGYNEPLPGPFPENPFAEFADTCFVSSGEDPVDPVDPVDPYPEGTPLDAGPQLTVEAGREIYTTLEPLNQGAYFTNFENPPTQRLPDSNLTIDIPGAEFPAFTDVAFASAPELVFTSPADPSSITRDTVFSWTGAGSSQSVVLISGGDAETGFSCIAQDDGSFSFPSETKAELDAAGFTAGALDSAGRMAVRTVRQDDAVLTLSILRSTSYGDPGDPPSPSLGVEQLLGRFR